MQYFAASIALLAGSASAFGSFGKAKAPAAPAAPVSSKMHGLQLTSQFYSKRAHFLTQLFD